MKRFKQLATVGIALSLMGVLAGCATGNNTTGSSARSNTANQAVTNTSTNTATNVPANTTTNTTRAVGPQTSGNQTGTNTTAPTTSNTPGTTSQKQQTSLRIVEPTSHAFKPGSTIKVNGWVTGSSKHGTSVAVSLYWGNRPIANRLIHSQTFGVVNSGAFGGPFNVPNTSFVGASGGEFVLVFQYPNAKMVTINMATPEVKAGS